MRILNWAQEERPAGFGDFEITWELYSGEIVRAKVKSTDCESRIFISYLVWLTEDDAEILGLEPGYNLMVQGAHYERNV